MWKLPRSILTYVLVVDGVAIATTVGAVWLEPVTRTDAIRLAILVACTVTYVELARKTELTRKLTIDAGPFLDGMTPWNFAAALVLPPTLASALVLFDFVYVWLRVWRGRRPLYRWAFTSATVLLGTQLAALVLAMGPGPHPGISVGASGLPLVLVAATLRWFVNYALVVGAILLSTPSIRAAQIFNRFSDQLVEAGALGLGLVAAGLLELDPYLLFGVVIGLVALHRSLLLTQFRSASRTDDKTGLHTAAWWHQLAEQAFRQARSTSGTVAVFMLDLDHFKRINDTYGHLAGDEVLRSVAQAIMAEVRTTDAVGRWGGEEFAVLLPEVNSAELATIGERIRRRVRSLAVLPNRNGDGEAGVGLTISIGGAYSPSHGIGSIDDLLLAADTALYAAKQAGRDRVHIPFPVGRSVAGQD